MNTCTHCSNPWDECSDCHYGTKKKEKNNSMKILKTQCNFDLIEISKDEYCVRKRWKNWLGKEKSIYMRLDKNGVRFEYEALCGELTIGDLDRCEHIYNANVIMAGGL